ncbi:MAG: type II toxin-antitoxin system VapC family toxin [Deltaproteobacteria bacterium]|nr:type II toxin-antitoxin system VapC family toxin [Deltaproteobacteria bacterium]
MANEAFLDAAYAIVLSSHRDFYHKRASILAEELEAAKTELITTNAVMLEIGNALSKLKYREFGVKLLEAIEQDPKITVIPMSEIFYNEAFRLYRKRLDKEWGLTDCVSFIIMRNRKINEALTTDEHFKQAGFRALLLE